MDIPLVRYCHNSSFRRIEVNIPYIVLTLQAELLHMGQSVVGIPGLATKLDREHTKRV